MAGAGAAGWGGAAGRTSLLLGTPGKVFSGRRRCSAWLDVLSVGSRQLLVAQKAAELGPQHGASQSPRLWSVGPIKECRHAKGKARAAEEEGAHPMAKAHAPGSFLPGQDKSPLLPPQVSQLWKDVVTRVGKDYPDIELSHMWVQGEKESPFFELPALGRRLPCLAWPHSLCVHMKGCALSWAAPSSYPEV